MSKQLLSLLIDRYLGRICQALMYLFAIGSGFVAYLWGVGAIMSGLSVTMGIGLFVLSPVMMALVRLCVERNRKVAAMFDLETQAWGFVIGDTLVLTLVAIALTRGWQSVGPTSPYQGWDWFWVAYAGGLVVSAGFRYMLDRPRYEKFDAMRQFYSPTKLWHDFAVFPAVVGLMIWAWVPQLDVWNFHTSIALIMLVLFMALNGRDAYRKVDPKGQHPAWNPREFEPA